jgi:hypothetical protein
MLNVVFPAPVSEIALERFVIKTLTTMIAIIIPIIIPAVSPAICPFLPRRLSNNLSMFIFCFLHRVLEGIKADEVCDNESSAEC